MTWASDHATKFGAVKTLIEGLSSTINHVCLGVPEFNGNFPTAIVNPGDVNFQAQTLDELTFNVLADWEVILVVSETTSSDVFSEVLTPLGAVLEAVMSDPTLSGQFLNTLPLKLKPGNVSVNGLTYWGGSVSFKSLYEWSP